MLRNGKDKVAFVFFVVVFLVYLSTMSISLDDEDSVHFALGLIDFNVSKYQPHPPGFPVYIAFGMTFNAFFQDEILSLTFMSALFGVLSIFVFYCLAKEMFGDKIAFLSSILMAFTPLFWLSSVKAMSDMTGLFFLLLSMVFIYRYVKYGNPRDFYLGSLLSGITAGVRIHSLFILVPLLLYSVYKHKEMKETNLKGGLLLLIAILVWFVPLILVTGVSEYFSSAGSQFMYRVEKPYMSLLGSDFTENEILYRTIGFPYFFLFGGYGINVGGLGLLSVMLLVFIVALGVLFLKKINPRDERFVFFFLGTIPYLIAVFVMLPPINPRYLLILVPLLSLVFANVIWGLKKPNTRYILFGILVFLILFHSVFLVLQIRTKSSPPVQLIEYVNGNYGSGDVIISEGFMEKYFDYYKTDLMRLGGSEDCEAIRNLVSEGRSILTISSNEICGLKATKIAGFYRDPRAHVKRSVVNLYELSSK